MAPEPVTEAEKDEIRRLHAQGKSLRQIARDMGRSQASVSRHAANLGLTFDRSRTAAATHAAVEDNRARRARIVAWQYQRALKIAERLDGETWTTATRTQAGCLTDVLGMVPADDELSMSRAMGQYVKAAADLEKIDAGDGAEGARSMLGDLMGRLRGQLGQ